MPSPHSIVAVLLPSPLAPLQGGFSTRDAHTALALLLLLLLVLLLPFAALDSSLGPVTCNLLVVVLGNISDAMMEDACLWSWLMADFSKSIRLEGGQSSQDSGVDPHPLKMSRPAGWYRTYVGAPVGGWGISGCFAPTLHHELLHPGQGLPSLLDRARDCLATQPRSQDPIPVYPAWSTQVRWRRGCVVAFVRCILFVCVSRRYEERPENFPSLESFLVGVFKIRSQLLLACSIARCYPVLSSTAPWALQTWPAAPHVMPTWPG